MIAWRLPFLILIGLWAGGQYPEQFTNNITFAVVMVFGGIICTAYDLAEVSAYGKG